MKRSNKLILIKVSFPFCLAIIVFIYVTKNALISSNNSIINREINLHNIDFYNILNLKPQNISELLGKKRTILIMLNATCPICVYEIYNWIDFTNDVNSGCFNLIFIITAVKPGQFTENFDGLIPNAYYLWDKKEQFIKRNSFLRNDYFSQVILLNENNKIILQGSPLYSKNIAKKYKRKLKCDIE